MQLDTTFSFAFLKQFAHNILDIFCIVKQGNAVQGEKMIKKQFQHRDNFILGKLNAQTEITSS